jgi:hypothetical protein
MLLENILVFNSPEEKDRLDSVSDVGYLASSQRTIKPQAFAKGASNPNRVKEAGWYRLHNKLRVGTICREYCDLLEAYDLIRWGLPRILY